MAFLWCALFEPGLAQDPRPVMVGKVLSLVLGPFLSPSGFSAQVTSCTPTLSVTAASRWHTHDIFGPHLFSEFQADIVYYLVYISSLENLGGIFQIKEDLL